MLNKSFFFFFWLAYLIKPEGKPSQETKTPKPNKRLSFLLPKASWSRDIPTNLEHRVPMRIATTCFNPLLPKNFLLSIGQLQNWVI